MGWVKFVWVRMIPRSMRICVPNLVAVRLSCRKKGGVEAHRHTHKRTLQLHIVDRVVGLHLHSDTTATSNNTLLQQVKMAVNNYMLSSHVIFYQFYRTCCKRVIPCQINRFLAIFPRTPSDSFEIWHTCRNCLETNIRRIFFI